jgi:hypothetical protein
MFERAPVNEGDPSHRAHQVSGLSIKMGMRFADPPDPDGDVGGRSVDTPETQENFMKDEDRNETRRADRVIVPAADAGRTGTEAAAPNLSEPLVIATSDPTILMAARFQPEWKRHPEATISLVTNPIGEPMRQPINMPESLNRAGHGSAAGTLENRDRTQLITPSPPSAKAGHVRQSPAYIQSRKVSGAQRGELRRRTRSARRRWVTFGALLLGTAVGFATCLSIVGTPRRAP